MQPPYLTKFAQVFLEELVVALVLSLRLSAAQNLEAGGEVRLGEVYRELHRLLALGVHSNLIVNGKDLRHFV